MKKVSLINPWFSKIIIMLYLLTIYFKFVILIINVFYLLGYFLVWLSNFVLQIPISLSYPWYFPFILFGKQNLLLFHSFIALDFNFWFLPSLFLIIELNIVIKYDHILAMFKLIVLIVCHVSLKFLVFMLLVICIVAYILMINCLL